MAQPSIVAMIMAGGKGERLHPLTKERAKPAVPFGGKYRIIDFVLSNFVNSNITAIYVLTQFKAQSLLNHLRDGWQFGTLLEATIPYDSALELILQQTNDQTFKSVLSDVRGRVVEGAYLADAFSRYPRVFPPMVVNMVRSGEASGTLPMIMHRLADYYDNLSRLQAKLTSALVYPLFMMVVGMS